VGELVFEEVDDVLLFVEGWDRDFENLESRLFD